ncbi:uncharacterized protein [Aegilops tauschii subsp. strangulata]|uniref:DUF1677 domain-containing protein n=2 Tax=Triticinae TaxID=1648030 RepID=A0A453IXG0_AEGTS|nr:uncharacterized protein LOC109748633 [Aegilops tauschii subsp. strangulata]XP_044376640.1 uncharacterized protein LOC123098656 [Triticum aestivum]
MSAVVAQDVAPPIEAASAAEVEWAACACCGLREECTAAYAAGVRAQYAGRWLCGLCGDAVGEELAAAGAGGGGSATAEVEAAIARHAAFCRSSPAAAERLIAAVRRLLRSQSGRKPKAVVVLEFQEA